MTKAEIIRLLCTRYINRLYLTHDELLRLPARDVLRIYEEIKSKSDKDLLETAKPLL